MSLGRRGEPNLDPARHVKPPFAQGIKDGAGGGLSATARSIGIRFPQNRSRPLTPDVSLPVCTPAVHPQTNETKPTTDGHDMGVVDDAKETTRSAARKAVRASSVSREASSAPGRPEAGPALA